MAKIGGKREGAGRKPGTANVKTREIADKAAEEGITPLEYMLNVMRSPMPPELAQAISNGKIGEDVVLRLSGWNKMRYEAAKDSAPYIHPRLQTTTVAGDKTKPIAIVLSEANVL